MPFFSKKYYPVRKIIFFLGEGLLILSSILLVLILFSSWKMFVVVPQEFLLRAVLVTVIFQTRLYFYDLYDLRKPGTTAETIIRMMQAFGTGCILLAGVYFTIPALIISTTTFWGCYAIICLVLVASFLIFKFRSMRQDAEKNGAVWASKNDARVTRVGNFIRKVRIDEIPQMWNVIRGQMSFVGPRPERPVFVEQLSSKLPYYTLRHSSKPGITGWAQVCYPYGASEEDALRKLEYDLYYIKHQSLFLDLLIIFRTIKTVLFQKGSR